MLVFAFSDSDLTALGTLALALATFALASKTRILATSGDKTAKAAEETAKAAQKEVQIIRDQADAMQRQSEVAEAALNASVRPLLIDVPLHTTQTIEVRQRSGEKRPEEVDLSVISAAINELQRTGSLTVPIRNIGAGVALGLAVAATPLRGDVGEPAIGEVPSAIAAGEVGYLRFEDTAGPASASAETPLVRLIRSGEDLVVEVAYSDAAGRQEAATSVYLTKSGRTDRAYRVTSVELGHDPRLTDLL